MPCSWESERWDGSHFPTNVISRGNEKCFTKRVAAPDVNCKTLLMIFFCIFFCVGMGLRAGHVGVEMQYHVVLQCVAMCCSVLQCVAVCCSVL